MNILLLTPGPEEDPSTRYRFLQFQKYLRAKNVKITYKPFFTKYLYKIKNKQGIINELTKFFLVTFCCVRRILIAFFLPYIHDLVIIHREAFPFGPPFVEKMVIALNKNTIYDFDDAVFAYPKENLSWRSYWLDPIRVKKIIKSVKAVTCANKFLEDYAKKYNHNVFRLPTVVDTNKYQPKKITDTEKITIGWIGTISNLKYLKIIKRPLRHISGKYPNVTLKIVSSAAAKKFTLPEVKLEYKEWKLKEEISDIATFDIGLMPLGDTTWERGKAAFKLIQYMATGIPGVASAVGANKEVIDNNHNGFLATSEEDWTHKLEHLISDWQLRKNFGNAARKTIVKRYSVQSALPEMITIWRTIKNS